MKTFKFTNTEQPNFVLLDEEKIETKRLCETYSDYGQIFGCYDAGCYSPDNSASDYNTEDEESHVECNVYEYHDGHNWVSLIVGINPLSEQGGDLMEVDEDLDCEILEHYDRAEWGEWSQGYCNGKTEKYEFIKSQWQGDFGYADVNII